MRLFARELLYAVRSLSRNRTFAWVAVSTLALGIAANAIVFSIFSAVLLRPLPYPNAGRLVVLHWASVSQPPGQDVSAQAFLLAGKYAHSFSAVTAIHPLATGSKVSGNGIPRYVQALLVSYDFFHTLGVMPAQGRPFTVAEDRPGGPPVAVLSHPLWTQLFGDRPFEPGRAITINDAKYSIIGVMPAHFLSYPAAELWLPLQLSPSTAETGSNYRVIALLRPGVTHDAAQNELQTLAWQQNLKRLPNLPRDSATLGLEDLHRFEVNKARKSLVILFGSVFFLLMIACANIAVLLLVRASARAHEIATRAALGASRARLLRIFLMESLVLAFVGGLLGLIFAKEAVPVIAGLIGNDLMLQAPIRIDWNVVLFAIGICFLTTLLFGLAPALRLFRLDLNDLLRQAPRGASPSARSIKAGRILVGIQTALTLILLSGATLMSRTFVNLRSVPLGFDPRHLLVAQLPLSGSRFTSTASTARLLDRIMDELRALPGVESVAADNAVPLEKGMNLAIHPADAPALIEHAAEFRIVSPEYFRTLQVPIVEGREFSGSGDSSPVVIVNQTLARRWWPHESAIGHFLKVGEELGPEFHDLPRRVIAVVADTHAAGLSSSPGPAIYVPLRQEPDNFTAFSNKTFMVSLLIRTQSQADLSGDIRRAVLNADPELPVASLRSMTGVIESSLARPRLYASLTTAFAAFALLLTAIALHGLLSYQTRLRTTEVAIRVAVGAKRKEIISLTVRQAVEPVVIGAALGVLAPDDR